MDFDYSGGDHDIGGAVTGLESAENTTKSQGIDHGY